MINFAANLNKMIDAGLGGPLDPPRTEVAVGHRTIYTEVSGAVASFESNVIAPVKNLRVTMEPFQDLHGYDHPWPAGGGKNLVNWVGPQTLTSQTTFAEYTTSEQTQFTASITAAKNNNINGMLNIYAYNGNTLVKNVGKSITSTTSDRVSVTIDLTETEYTLLRIVLTGAASGYSVTCSELQLEKGNAASDFTPYSNICPITGRDIVRIWREATYDPDATPALNIQLGQTVYGGRLDVSRGRCYSLWANIPSYAGEVLPGEWISDRDVYAPGAVPTIGAQVVYKREIADMIILTPAQLSTLAGENNIWSDAGNISLEFPYYEETEGY